MKNRDVSHDSMNNYLVSINNNNKIVNFNDDVFKNEVVTVCKDYGNLFFLFDNVFDIVNKKRGCCDDGTIKSYINYLQWALRKWIQINFTITHKLHLLLVNTMPQLRIYKGESHLRKSAIERAHQTQGTDYYFFK